MDKSSIKLKEQQLLELTKAFCNENLDKDYLNLSEKLILKLGRKRNVPFASGKLEIWAAAIIHALGTINFLFDKSAEPYLSISDINDYFGTKQSTVGGKSKQIRDLLKLNYFDKDFSTPAIAGSNPFADMVMVNGLITPLNSIPEEFQKMVLQARAEGRDISFTTED